MQYFFVDESGDPGLHNPRNSPYYIVAMAQLPNREPIAEIAALRRKLRLAPAFEFHFYQTNSKQKEYFFQVVQPVLFRARVAVLIKSSMPSDLRDLNSTELAMELLTRLTLRASPLDIANDILVLDSAPDSFLKSLRIHLTQAYKHKRRERPFKKIVSSDSRHDDGLQLADMIAGAVRQHIWEHDSAYYQMFSKKVTDLCRVR
jgi:hypothetical protein